MYDSSWAKIEPTSRSPSALDSSEYGRVGSRCDEPALAAQCDEHRDGRRQHERDAVPTGRGRRDDHEDDAEDDARRAFGAEQHPVRAEPPVARERAARDERDVVTDDRDDEAEHQRAVAVEQVVDDPLVPAEAADDHDDREQPAELGRALDERAAADAVGVRCASERPTSCSSGWNKPGVTMNTTAHSTLTSVYASPESCLAARIWKAYAVMPRMIRPTPTAYVPPGAGSFFAAPTNR